MQADYRAFIDRMINKYEGGYCWDKGDPGGPTKYGITCYDLAEHRGQRMTSMSTWAPMVHDMTLAEAEDIYNTKYAHAIDFDGLPAGVDCVVMDYAVNSGIGRATLVLRRLLNSDNQKSIPDMLPALASYGTVKFINDMCDERLRYMHAIRNGTAWEEFGKGWGARVADLRQYSVALANKVPAATAPDLSKVPTPKATHTADKSTDASNAGKVIVATGTAGAAKAAGVPVWMIVTGIVVVFVAAIAWEVWKVHLATKANEVVHV